MFKIRIDGMDFEVTSETAVQAFAKYDAAMKAQLEAVKGEVTTAKKSADQLQAKFDSATTEVEKLKKDAAEAPKKIREEIAARSALETKARKVLGDKATLDGLDAKGVQLKVLAKLAPEAKFDGKSNDYVEARFDSELERFDADDEADGTQGTTARREAGSRVDAADEVEREDGGQERVDADVSRAKLIKGAKDLWKKPIGASLNEDHDVRIVK